MSGVLTIATAGIIIYALIALGVATGIRPRGMFTRLVERFVVRVSCGLMWPMFVGYVLAHRVNTITATGDENQ